MKKRNKVMLGSVAALGLVVALAIYFVWPRNHLEVQVKGTIKSPDGKWDAVVQMEVYNSAWVVNDAVYAVRLKGPEQKDRLGDLVMNVPVNTPTPEPSIDWSSGSGTLVVTLADHEKLNTLQLPLMGLRSPSNRSDVHDHRKLFAYIYDVAIRSVGPTTERPASLSSSDWSRHRDRPHS